MGKFAGKWVAIDSQKNLIIAVGETLHDIAPYVTGKVGDTKKIKAAAFKVPYKDEVADELGIKIEKGEGIYLGGVGGRIKGYIHKLNVEIAGKKFNCPIVFSREYLVSFNLLGRDSFFPKFRIIFEEKKNQVQLDN